MAPISRRRFIHILAGSSALLCPISRAVASNLPSLKWSGQALGAAAEITLVVANRQHGQRLITAALAEIARLESIFSLYQADSAIRQLNSQGFLDNPPPELVELIEQANKLSVLSGGAFDITVQPLWHYLYYLDGDLPNPSRLERLMQCIGYRNLHCTLQRIWFSKPGMQITLNGIAQGFITDRVATLLRSRGLDNALVELGETFALGRNPSFQPWQVGIMKPDRSGVAATLTLENRAIATSGGYGTAMGRAGNLHHILDPRSAKSPDYFGSVSVVAPNATWADGLSTTLYLLTHCNHSEVLRHYPGSYEVVLG